MSESILENELVDLSSGSLSCFSVSPKSVGRQCLSFYSSFKGAGWKFLQIQILKTWFFQVKTLHFGSSCVRKGRKCIGLRKTRLELVKYISSVVQIWVKKSYVIMQIELWLHVFNVIRSKARLFFTTECFFKKVLVLGRSKHNLEQCTGEWCWLFANLQLLGSCATYPQRLRRVVVVGWAANSWEI